MKQRFTFLTIILTVLGTVFLVSDVSAATTSRAPEVKIFDAEGLSLEKTFFAFDEAFRGGGSIATGDLDCDGTDEIVVGAGPGGGPQVRVFQGDGTPLRSFFVYPLGFKGGVRVAVGDLNGDCRAEIVTAPGQGGGPYIRHLNQFGEATLTPGYFAYAEDFRGGVNITIGDIDGDGKGDVITGTGVGGGPHVRAFSRFGEYMGVDFFPFAARDRGGVSVAAANVDGGPEDELIFTIHRFGRSRIKAYKTDGSERIIGEFEGWPESVQGGFNVAGGDLDNDGYDEVLAAVAAGGGPHLRAFEAYGGVMPQNFFPYESDFHGGVAIAVGDVDGDGRTEIITMPGRKTIQGRTDLRKYIEVNLTEQRLYAYENGQVVKTFLISSGISKYPTPEGTFSVTAKIPIKDYEWSYGPNNPDNYLIEDVENNLRFAPHYYLHGTYWHDNFGTPMSHGCINISMADSAWIYAWAGVGTPVIIHK